MDFEIRRGALADVDRLESLWQALYAHHALLPAMPGKNSLEDSWEYRSAQYREWLGDDRHALLLAERDGEPVGYAMVSIGGGAATWDLGEPTVEIETLSVLESERGKGVGRALTDAAVEVAGDVGARTVLVGVAHSNEDALRFYEREGFGPFYIQLAKT